MARPVLTEMQITQHLNNAQFTIKRGNAFADAFNYGIHVLNHARFQYEFEAGLKKLLPEINRYLARWEGVLLCVVFDEVEQSPGETLCNFINVYIKGHGLNKDKAISQAELPTIGLPTALANQSRVGCDINSSFCKKSSAYIWITKFGMEYFL